MNVGELIKKLEQYPKDLEVLHSMHSDYWAVTENDFGIIKAVYNEGVDFYMASHPSMSLENKANEKEYLLFF